MQQKPITHLISFIKPRKEALGTLVDFLKKPSTSYYNHRDETSYLNKKPWKYQTNVIKDEQETDPNFKNNILWRSRYGIFKDFMASFDLVSKNIYMADLLMFNKNYVLTSTMDTERCLSLIRFNYDDVTETTRVDNWSKKDYLCMSTREDTYGQCYRVAYNDTVPLYTLVNNDYDKHLAARALIAIMNETKTEDLNMQNYYYMVEWEAQNEFLNKAYISAKYLFLKENLEINAVSDINPIIKIDDVVTKEFVEKQVNDESQPLEVVDGCVNLSKLINDKLNIKSIVDYCELYRNEHIYCNDVPMELMLVELYNRQPTTGCGFMNAKSETLTIDEAKKLIEKNKYIDYLNGVRMKLNFDTYPLLNIARYDRTYEKGAAMQVYLRAKDIMSGKQQLSNREDYF